MKAHTFVFLVLLGMIFLVPKFAAVQAHDPVAPAVLPVAPNR